MEPPVCVVGDSHVRSFARHAAFFPLFAGPGRELCFLDARRTETTRARLAAVVDRIPSDWPLLFVLGEPDVRQYMQSGAAAVSPKERTAFIEACAERCVGVLRGVVQSGRRVAVYNVVPASDPTRRDAVSAYNKVLREQAVDHGWAFIDLSDDVSPGGATQARYVGDPIHLNENVAPLVVDRLAALGWLPPTTPRANNFSWSRYFRLPIGDGHEIRIWGDVSKETGAERATRSEALLSALHVVGRAAGRAGLRSATIFRCLEGFALYGLPQAMRVAAIDCDPSRLAAAQRLAVFMRRDNVSFHLTRGGEANLAFRTPGELLILDRGEDDADGWQELGSHLMAAPSWTAAVIIAPREDDIRMARDAGCHVLRLGEVSTTEELLLAVKQVGPRAAMLRAWIVLGKLGLSGRTARALP